MFLTNNWHTIRANSKSKIYKTLKTITPFPVWLRKKKLTFTPEKHRKETLFKTMFEQDDKINQT